MYIEHTKICPFLGKECIGCGDVQQSAKHYSVRSCIFYDEYFPSETEPCLIKRAVNKILDIPDCPDDNPVEVPWDAEEKE